MEKNSFRDIKKRLQDQLNNETVPKTGYRRNQKTKDLETRLSDVEKSIEIDDFLASNNASEQLRSSFIHLASSAIYATRHYI